MRPQILPVLLLTLLLPYSALAQSLPLPVTQALASEQNPCLSPDQRHLAFTRFLNGYNQGPSALVLLDLETGRERILASDNEHDHVNLPGRCFSPDGGRIAYSSDASGNDEIWVLDLESGERAQITRHQDEQAFEPAFTHDGQHLVFELAAEGRQGRICIAALDGTDEHCLTPGESDDRQPNPKPDLDQVIFQSDRGGTWGIWAVPLEGGHPVPVLDTDAEETDASWAPDGHSIVFATDACEALSCVAVYGHDMVTVHQAPPGWYQGAPAMAANGTIFVEACPGDPEESGGTAIYRLP